MSAQLDVAAALPAHHEVAPEELVKSFEEADRHEASLAGYSFEDWVCLGFFWAMAALVFLQFFTRYVLNNSLAWTEEIAANCLVVVVFLGSVWCVRRSRHIQVDVLYHYLLLLFSSGVTFVSREDSDSCAPSLCTSSR